MYKVDEDVKKLDSIFAGILNAKLKESKKINLCLSSGTDSNLILFYLLDLKKEVEIFSFHKEGVNSIDFINAKRNAKTFDLKFNEIIIPKKLNIDILINFIKKYKVWKKTIIEVCYCFEYVFSKCQENTITISGLGGDDFHGLTKTAVMHYKDDLNGFNKYRNKSYVEREEQYKILQNMANKYKIDFFTPYLDKTMYSFFNNRTWKELNEPKQKKYWLLLKPRKFKYINYVKHSNLQCGDTGIREIFEILLTSEYNKKNRKRVIDIYRDILNGI